MVARKLKRTIASSLLIVGLFGVGAVFGTYYHNEIIVLWQNLIRQPRLSEIVTTSEPVPMDKLERSSYLTLPNVPEPLPLVYSDTLEEATLQEYLREGAVVLPLGTSFGQPGNGVITAHSSGTEAFGPYRFAFAQLSELKEGDEYAITTPTATYTYRVYAKEVVWPHQVDQLPQDDRSTVTLVTCWPLWTNFKRLLVHTELIHTDYSI